MVDFAFMSELAYTEEEFIQDSLEAWFGSSTAEYLNNTGCTLETKTVVRAFKLDLRSGFEVVVISVKGEVLECCRTY